MQKKEDLLDELLGIKKPTGEKEEMVDPKRKSGSVMLGKRPLTDSKPVGRITIPETIRTGSKTIADTSVLRAFHLFMTGKHDRGPKGDLINKLIIELKKL